MLLLGLALYLLTGCAYFNTYYNATTYYQQGVKALEAAGNLESDRIPAGANDAFASAIEKSLKVIDQYPDSRYVDDAFFIIGRSHYYRQEYGLAERNLRQLLDEYTWIDYANEIRIWLAKVHAEMGLYDLVEEDLAPILAMDNPPRKLLTEVYVLRGELALRQEDVPGAMRAFEQGAELAVKPAQKSVLLYRLYTLAREVEDYPTSLDFLDQFARATPNEDERINARLTRVQLLQHMDDIDGAYREIRNMVNLSEFASIIPGLQLEIGKIEHRNGNTDEALTHFTDLIEEFRRMPEASEAAFYVGNIYLTEFHNIESASDYFSRVRNNSIYFGSAREKLKQITTLKKMHARIRVLQAQLDSESEPATSTEADTSAIKFDSAPVRQELAYANYRVGEIRLFELNDVSSGLEVMADIVTNFEETDVAAQAAYVLYYHTKDEPDQAAFWRSILLEKYPQSPYSLTLDDETSATGNPRLDALLVRADAAVESDPRFALQLFQTIHDQFRTEQASFSIAYLYDEYLGQLDQAIAAYEDHLNLHPAGVYSEQAEQRLAFLMGIKAELPTEPQQEPN